MNPQPPHRRGVFTLAYGKQRYIEMAKDLGRSLELHSPNTPRGIFTDSRDPELLRLFPYQTSLPDGLTRIPPGLEAKLYLPDFAPFEESLFIDSDCLVVGSLDDCWLQFADVPVGVLGRRHATLDIWYADSERIKRELHVDTLVGFNGGCYFVRKTQPAFDIFAAAREFRDRYDELQIHRLGKGINEEPLVSLALTARGIDPIDDDDAPLMRTVRRKLELDLETGACRLLKRGRLCSPRILHFCSNVGQYYYERERYRLRRLAAGKSLGPLANTWSKAVGLAAYLRHRTNNALHKCRRRLSASPIASGPACSVKT